MKHVLCLVLALGAFLLANDIPAATTRYVNVANPTPAAPYLTWETAATVIQDAINAATAGDEIIVTNGVYSTGAVAVYGMSNRVAVTKPVTVRSVNGPEVTVIQGYQVPGTTNGPDAVRCVYLTNSAVLAGFTLTNGATQRTAESPLKQRSGGGVWCESGSAFVSNCVITGNSADWNAGGTYLGTLNHCTLKGNSTVVGIGGGAYYSSLSNCLLTGNSALFGGGAVACTLNSCTVTDNFARSGVAGAHNCTLNNCIVFYNNGSGSPDYQQGILTYCCTTPLPSSGIGNISNEPAFMDSANGDYRLQANSPCINAGNNAYVTSATDLDGNPRISGGTVDIGAYEFQNPASQLSYAWLQQYGLPTDGTADTADPDNDQRNNLQEWRCLTDPTNAASVLRLMTTAPGSPGVNVTWASATNRLYFLERSLNLGLNPAFQMIATNVPGFTNTTTYLDTNATGPGPFFYRVAVQQ